MLLATLIEKTRRNVHDWHDGNTSLQKYSDVYYTDAADASILKLNRNLKTSYTVASLPTTLEDILVLLCSIYMCRIRMTEEDKDDADGSDYTGTLKRLEIDGLETEHYEGKIMRPSDWAKLCDTWQDEYDDFLEEEGPPEEVDDLPRVAVVTINRSHLRRGRAFRHRELDRGVTAPAILIAQDTLGRLITWTPVYDNQFCFYEIQRKLSTEDWDDDARKIVVVAQIADNHVDRYRATATLTPATYTYRMAVINRNQLRNYSNDVEVTIV